LLLATLMPLGDQSAADGYIARLEQWAGLKGCQTLAELGVFPHVLMLDNAPPLDIIRRPTRITHAPA